LKVESTCLGSVLMHVTLCSNHLRDGVKEVMHLSIKLPFLSKGGARENLEPSWTFSASCAGVSCHAFFFETTFLNSFPLNTVPMKNWRPNAGFCISPLKLPFFPRAKPGRIWNQHGSKFEPCLPESSQARPWAALLF